MSKKAFVVTGLGYGDEGKGTIVDYLARKYSAVTVVRYNGGPQAAHNVTTPEGITHCFAQFGSGTFSGAETYLSGFTPIDPLAIENEEKVLREHGIENVFEKLFIDKKCLVVTPFHRTLNRMLEISRGSARHGSCGMGVGQTIADGKLFGSQALRAEDLKDEVVTRGKLDFLRRVKLDLAEQIIAEHPDNPVLVDYVKRLQYDFLEDLIEYYKRFTESGVTFVDEKYLEKSLKKDNVIFEGAQGVLIDAERGFWPHVTKSRVTFQNAEMLLKNSGYDGEVVRVGVLRAYHTRHGKG